MIHAQNFKVAQAIVPALVDNAAATMVEVDTLGYDYCTFVVLVGATDIASSVLKVTECATSGGTFTDVTGLIGGTSNTIAGTTSAQLAADSDSTAQIFELPLSDRERFLKFNMTAGDGSAGINIAVVALLSRLNDGTVEDTASARGCSQILRLPA